MKFINPEDAPVQPTPRQPMGTWRPIYDGITSGQAVVLEKSDYEDENKTRNAISLSMKRWGVPVTIRKDPATGDLYVFKKTDEDGETADVPLTGAVNEWLEADK